MRIASADTRDREPAQVVPADAGHALDPDWVLKMRAYLEHYRRTGVVHWVKRGKAWAQ